MRYCRLCEISERFPDDIDRYVKQYIETLPEDSRTSDEEYVRRIELCAVCDRLEAGICRSCGCFVGVRAAVRSGVCPYEYW